MTSFRSIYFTDNANGTVTDRCTGLTWLKFAIGQEWDGVRCIGEPNMLTRSEADDITFDFAGFGDWRLPSKEEIESLLFFSQKGFFDPVAFPENGSYGYWTATSSPSTSTTGIKGRFIFRFDEGKFRPSLSMTLQLAVRLVRGEVNTFVPTFIENGDGTATDPRTGLQWMIPLYGQEWLNSEAIGEAKELNFESAQNIRIDFAGHSDWQVPDCDMLRTLLIKLEGKVSALSSQLSSGAAWSRTVSAQNLPFAGNFQGQSYMFNTSFDSECFVVFVRQPSASLEKLT